MARTWTAVYGSVCTSKKLRRCTNDSSRLLYFLLLLQADAYGRIEDDPETIVGLCWPNLGKTERETEKALSDLSCAGLIARHRMESLSWIQVASWDDHAGKHRGGTPGKSRFPDPPRISPNLPDPPRSSPDLPETSGEFRGSILLSSPSPLVLEGEGAGRGKAGPVDWATYQLPPELDRPEIREALIEHAAVRAENGHKPHKAHGAKMMLRQLVEWGPDRAVEVLRHSAPHQGLYLPNGRAQTNGKPYQHAFEKTGDAIDAVFGKRTGLPGERTVEAEVVKPKEIGP